MTQEGINQTTAADLDKARGIFMQHGIGDLLGVQIVNRHDGSVATVDQALQTCGPFADGLITMAETLEGMEQPGLIPVTLTDYINGQRDSAAGEV